ncbi:uncharacterized protein BX663DRAFT_533457 [Cokeromyces recurvatus]|uniref:uncharacterized protein n=1 Tax=Cokeromyces recurvatus TaxID=90255 RepID=UPI002220FC9B|nr:uncharacterized protein BX663DRAFT_533457 [Cokeromyces recurvatus]KAI7898242.1 hypothetical protein BX663DRAFT_533457 [Cokeromyces recurvatus]
MDPLRLRPSRYPAEMSEKLLTAIRQHNPLAVWKAYQDICDKNNLSKLPAEYHSMALQAFQLKRLKAYGPKVIKFYRKCLLHILENMKAQEHKLNVRDYNLFLDFYGRSHDWNSAVNCWKELNKEQQPNEYSYNLYLFAALQCKKYEEVFRIFNKMKESKIKPNESTCNIMIEAHGCLGHVQDADQIFSTYFLPKQPKQASLMSSLLHPELSTVERPSFTSLMAPIARSLPPPKMTDTNTIPAQFKPNRDTFIALINAHGRNKNVAGLSYIYNTMLPKYEIEPDLKIYNTLIEWFCFNGDIELARRMFVNMGKADVQPNAVTFQHLFRHEAIKRKRPKAAEDLINFMKNEYGIRPLLSMYQTLIKIHNKSNREDEAKRLHKEYIELKHKLSSPAHSSNN